MRLVLGHLRILTLVLASTWTYYHLIRICRLCCSWHHAYPIVRMVLSSADPILCVTTAAQPLRKRVRHVADCNL